jgi:hypothetical protein
MVRALTIIIFGLFCLASGLLIGVWFAPTLRSSEAFRLVNALTHKLPITKTIVSADNSSPFESYDYPTIKWRAKPLAQPEGAIAQLYTTYEWNDKSHQPGTGRMNYRFTVFKAGDRKQFEVQMLDDKGFKISQFDISDFRPVPGAPDIMDARDSHEFSEDEYKKFGDYAVN